MNGQPLPMLNGFPARLVVPGWYAVYWVKNLSEITIIDKEFDGFFVKNRVSYPGHSLRMYRAWNEGYLLTRCRSAAWL
jgi:sulfite dehydrogenase (cytochrome) subunit A